MSSDLRKKVVAANWKMNKTLPEVEAFMQEFSAAVKDIDGETSVVIAPPFPFLNTVSKYINDIPNVFLAAQNCHGSEKGSFTGEVSAPMIASCNAEYVIVGHSERRTLFHESSEVVKQKVEQVFAAGLIPIYCCGESLDERKKGEHFDVITNQLKAEILGLETDQLRQVIIAYEPVWAIGTGETATPEQAQEIHAHIRSQLVNTAGADIANGISILYGGSCKPQNAASLFANPDVDGGLIGGASLNVGDFAGIIQASLQLTT